MQSTRETGQPFLLIHVILTKGLAGYRVCNCFPPTYYNMYDRPQSFKQSVPYELRYTSSSGLGPCHYIVDSLSTNKSYFIDLSEIFIEDLSINGKEMELRKDPIQHSW